jgi:hypothetical protein
MALSHYTPILAYAAAHGHANAKANNCSVGKFGGGKYGGAVHFTGHIAPKGFISSLGPR